MILKFIKNPIKINVKEQKSFPETFKHYYKNQSKEMEKINTLLNKISTKNQSIIFADSKDKVKEICEEL